MLIPRTRATWSTLAQETLNGALTITRLCDTFGRLGGYDGAGDVGVEVESDTTGGDADGAVGGGDMGSNIVDDETLGRLFDEELRLLVTHGGGASRLALPRFDEADRSQVSGWLGDFALLRRLVRWLPALLRLHDLLAPISGGDVVADESEDGAPPDDPYRVALARSLTSVRAAWPTFTLASLAGIVAADDVIRGVRPLCGGAGSLEYLARLADAPRLVGWLLAHSATDEFNQLLAVVRPCTDEPRMLSAIASLVATRTLLLAPLHGSKDDRGDGDTGEGSGGPPYTLARGGLRAALAAFARLELGGGACGGGLGAASDGSPRWHLVNIAQNFDALLELMDKQTRSPGIKAVYDLAELLENGLFVFRLTEGEGDADTSSILTMEIGASDGEDSGGDTVVANEDGAAKDVPDGVGAVAAIVVVRDYDWLLDLRAKLLMTEVPRELEKDLGAAALVEGFVAQLELLGDIADVLRRLQRSGHTQYQAGYLRRWRCFRLADTVEEPVAGSVEAKEGDAPVGTGTTAERPLLDDLLAALREELGLLNTTLAAWERSTNSARSDYYWLNFFTMREATRRSSIHSRAASSRAAATLLANRRATTRNPITLTLTLTVTLARARTPTPTPTPTRI